MYTMNQFVKMWIAERFSINGQQWRAQVLKVGEGDLDRRELSLKYQRRMKDFVGPWVIEGDIEANIRSYNLIQYFIFSNFKTNLYYV